MRYHGGEASTGSNQLTNQNECFLNKTQLKPWKLWHVSVLVWINITYFKYPKGFELIHKKEDEHVENEPKVGSQAGLKACQESYKTRNRFGTVQYRFSTSSLVHFFKLISKRNYNPSQR